MWLLYIVILPSPGICYIFFFTCKSCRIYYVVCQVFFLICSMDCMNSGEVSKCKPSDMLRTCIREWLNALITNGVYDKFHFKILRFSNNWELNSSMYMTNGEGKIPWILLSSVSSIIGSFSSVFHSVSWDWCINCSKEAKLLSIYRSVRPYLFSTTHLSPRPLVMV